MAPPSRFSFLSFAAAVAAAVLLAAAVAPLRAVQASGFPEALDAGDAFFSDEALTHLSESLTKFLSDAKDLASRAVDSLRIPNEEDKQQQQQRVASRNSLAALLAADPLAGAALLPWPATPAPEASSPSRASARGASERRRGGAVSSSSSSAAAAAPASLDDDVLETLEALEAAGADTALFAPILAGEGEGEERGASVVAVAVDEAADGGVEASAVSVSSVVPLSPASVTSLSPPLLDAALDIQYGEGTAGASAVTRRVARWVSSLGDSPALVASLSSSSPSSSPSSSSSGSSLDAARGAFDAAADAIEAVGASLAAALESSPGADDAELDLAIAVDLVGGAGRESFSSRKSSGGGDGIVDVRIEASVVPGSGITNSMLAEALEGASFDAVVAAGAAGVEVVAARVDVFDDGDVEIDDDLSSSSLFSYSRREDAFCLYLGSSFSNAGYDRWACARRAPLSRALAATSFFFAAASAVAAFNALVPVSSSDESDSDSEGEEEEHLDEMVDEETALFIKPALWAARLREKEGERETI